MGRVHLVGEAPAGLSEKRRGGLRHLAIAVAAGALIWIGDSASGGHLAGAVNALASRLAVWFEDRREPVVTCEPGKPRPYTALAGVVLQIPQCWEVEIVSLLDREVHRFHDPEARAGTLSVSVEPIGSEEDRRDLAEEFRRMAALPGARLDGKPGAESVAGAAAADVSGDASADARYKPSVPDSLAERILHGSSQAAERDDASDRPGMAGSGATPARKTPLGGFRRVEAGGFIGIPPQPGKSALQADGTYGKRTWNWLLAGDREAIRIVYAVRADWSDSLIVAEEFRRASAVADSATEAAGLAAPAEPAPAAPAP